MWNPSLPTGYSIDYNSYPPKLTVDSTVYAVPISSPIEVQSKHLYLKTQFANGTESRRVIWSRPRDIMVLNHRGLGYYSVASISYRYLDILIKFYQYHSNLEGTQEGLFQFYDSVRPMGTYPGKLRFDDNGLRIVNTQGSYFDVSVTLVQVKDP